MRGFGADRLQLNDKFDVALQAGFDLALNDKGLGLNVDTKRYFLRTDANSSDASGTELLRTRHEIDPWVSAPVLSIGSNIGRIDRSDHSDPQGWRQV